jgi:hypothetical protein
MPRPPAPSVPPLDEREWERTDEREEVRFELPTMRVLAHTLVYEDAALRARVRDCTGVDHTWRFFFATALEFEPPLPPLTGTASVYGSVRSEARDAFVDDLRDRGIDPVFVVHADHGEAFGEHGTYGHLAYPYEEVTHVPLVVHGTEETGRVERPFSLLDLPDLLVAVADDRPLADVYGPGGASHGSSGDVAAVRENGGAPREREDGGLHGPPPWAITQVRDDGRQVTAIRLPGWKYVDRGGEEDDQLFALAADPTEQRDVSDDHPELLRACRRLRDAQSVANAERDAVHGAFDRLEA